MLNDQKIVAFVPTADAAKARPFYESTLGLRVISEDGFALVLDANGTMLRVTSVQNFKPQQFTILGWDVRGYQRSRIAPARARGSLRELRHAGAG